jgi:hypothetical protein
MLDSWTTMVSENKDQSKFFNPSVPQTPGSMTKNSKNYTPTRNDYEQYKWLFGPK